MGAVLLQNLPCCGPFQFTTVVLAVCVFIYEQCFSYLFPPFPGFGRPSSSIWYCGKRGTRYVPPPPDLRCIWFSHGRTSHRVKVSLCDSASSPIIPQPLSKHNPSLHINHSFIILWLRKHVCPISLTRDGSV